MNVYYAEQINQQTMNPLHPRFENYFKSKTSADTAAITPMKTNTFLSEERYTK